MATYRKLSIAEIEQIFGVKVNPDAERFRSVLAHIKKYYPATAVKAVAQFHSEYNDSRYDCKLQYLAVYDSSGEEVLPLAKTARTCRAEWGDLSIGELTYEEQDEPLDDVVIPLSANWVPELFVKEGV
jgi:hypothetical protein